MNLTNCCYLFRYTKRFQHGVSYKSCTKIQQYLIKGTREQYNIELFENIAVGVPQGSGLGSILFIIYIIELGKIYERHLVSFAEDTIVICRGYIC